MALVQVTEVVGSLAEAIDSLRREFSLVQQRASAVTAESNGAVIRARATQGELDRSTTHVGALSTSKTEVETHRDGVVAELATTEAALATLTSTHAHATEELTTTKAQVGDMVEMDRGGTTCLAHNATFMRVCQKHFSGHVVRHGFRHGMRESCKWWAMTFAERDFFLLNFIVQRLL